MKDITDTSYTDTGNEMKDAEKELYENPTDENAEKYRDKEDAHRAHIDRMKAE